MNRIHYLNTLTNTRQRYAAAAAAALSICSEEQINEEKNTFSFVRNCTDPSVHERRVRTRETECKLQTETHEKHRVDAFFFDMRLI